MLDRADKALSIRRQCMLLGIARSGVYRPLRPANDNDLSLMRRLDELYTAWPFLGSRRMNAMLKAEGLQVNRKRVQRLMRKMGIAALGPKPNTTKPAPGHKIYPYLLRNMIIDRPNQVWAADITYLPIGRGFLYLVAIIDWATLPPSSTVPRAVSFQLTDRFKRSRSLRHGSPPNASDGADRAGDPASSIVRDGTWARSIAG
jgi:putative transposase